MDIPSKKALGIKGVKVETDPGIVP